MLTILKIYFIWSYISYWVPVDSPQNQLAPANSPHIYANSPQPTSEEKKAEK